ncbi:MAG: hypothetical protein HY556_05730 [Euryarchaeota archaeon]|nr:hypothetical protein [Euryarchaeota archaeon]
MAELDPPTLLKAVAAVAVIFGVAFAVLQLRAAERKRLDAGALAAFQAWDTASMQQLDIVYALPDSASPDLIEKADADVRQAANGVYLRCEPMGLVVYQRLVPLRLVNEWAGGAIRVSWKRLRPWIEAKRRAAGSERPGEWFQWLADLLSELPARDEKVGAQVIHKGWRP